MTSGERAVWAAEFIAMFPRTDLERAARRACEAVRALRVLERGSLDDDDRAMLDDMLGNGSERVAVRAIDGRVVGEVVVSR